MVYFVSVTVYGVFVSVTVYGVFCECDWCSLVPRPLHAY